MSDVFQVLLPQGASATNLPLNPPNAKAGLGPIEAANLGPEGESAQFSFKIAFQNTASGARSASASMLPESLSFRENAEFSALLPTDETNTSGENLPSLPVAVNNNLPEEISSPELAMYSPAFMFSAQAEQSLDPAMEPTDFSEDAFFNKGTPNLISSFRTANPGVSAIALNQVPDNTDAASIADNSELATSAFTMSKLVPAISKDGTKNMSQALESQTSVGRLGMTGAQSFMGLGNTFGADRLANFQTVNEVFSGFDSHLQAKPLDAVSNAALVRQTADLAPSQSIALQATDNAVASESMKLSLRFGQPGWAEQLAERTANLAGQNIKQAEVQLNPQELGSIHIKISVSQEQAAVTFAAQNAQVREAIDQTLHRLRDAFESSGLELVQADVHDQRSGNEGADENEQGTSSAIAGDPEAEENQAIEMTATLSGIDHFV